MDINGLQAQGISGMGDPALGGAMGTPEGVPPPGPPIPEPGPVTRVEQPSQEDMNRRDLDSLLDTTNIADSIDKEDLDKIGDAVYDGFILDSDSKSDWDKNVDEWTKLAAQVKTEKTYPWPKASNVKYPLLATAAMQFAARAYPALVPADGKIVQLKVVGSDPQGLKAALADKLAKHMNYQLLEDMEDWEEEMDRLLIMLPVVGCVFKKTYFDEIKKCNVSRVVGPKDLVVNYWATSLDSAYRKTEIIQETKNQIQEKINAGIYLDVELAEPTVTATNSATVQPTSMPTKVDKSTPYTILEQHTFWDLDDDGYAEPYVITVEKASKKVLRMVARWDSDGVIKDVSDKLVKICPVEYYTKYGFIPNPDGGFYDIGFGHLLGPLNESANTAINLLIDAGHMSSLQGGFLGKGLRMKLGDSKFSPGEWKAVNATGDDIKKQILPLPTAEPSETLFKLLGTLIESGKELASVAEIFVGKMPGQNTPATTTMASIEQGMKVFTAIYKRTFRSLSKEFRKLFRLNSIHDENITKALKVLDEPISKMDYNPDSYDVCPTADPSAVSSTQKLLKAQGLMELLPLGTVNVIEVTKRVLEAQEQTGIQTLMQQPQQQEDPKVAAMKLKAESDQASNQQKMQMEQEKHQLEMAKTQFEAQMAQQEQVMNMKFMQMEKMMEMKLKEMEFEQKARHDQVKHVQDIAHTTQKNEVAIDAQKKKAEVRPKGKQGI